MKRRLTVVDLEEMTTHELGDLLGNIALVLSKLPNVPIEQVKASELEPLANARFSVLVMLYYRHAVRRERSPNKGL